MTGTAKLIGVLIILALAATVAAAIYRAGGKDALQGVERQNTKAGEKADDAAFDYDECRRANRLWNYVTDKCGGIAPSRRQ